MTLTELLSTYRTTKLHLESLEAQIKEIVLAGKETAEAPGVVAKYNNPRKSYQYEQAAREHATDEQIIHHTKPITDWRAVCKDAGLVNIPYTEGEPSVSFKVEQYTEEDIWQ